MSLALNQVRYESLFYWRNRRRVFFTFALPLMFVVVFALMEENVALIEHGGRRHLTFFIPGILAFGVVFTTFSSMASALAMAREQGVLKRVRGTPVSTRVYVAGHVGAALIVTALITVVVLALGAGGTLLAIAELFPVRMLVDALQHAYDPAVTGAAIRPQGLLLLAAWGLAGLWLSARFLRKEKADG